MWGALLAPSAVLTAAHCPIRVSIRIGNQDQENLTQPGCEIIDVEDFLIFPRYIYDLEFVSLNDYTVAILAVDSSNEVIPFLASSELDFFSTQKLRPTCFGRIFRFGHPSPVL